MKKLLGLTLFLPLISFAQEIKKSEFDQALKSLIVETSEAILKEDKNANLRVSLKSIGNNFFLELKGKGFGASTIQQNDPAIFLLANDQTVLVKSTSVQTYDGDQGKSSYEHEYSISLNNLKLLSQYNLKAVRKYGIRGSTDIDIPESFQFDLRKTALLFLSELVSKQVLTNEDASYTYVREINLNETVKYVGDSVSVCGLVNSSSYLKSSIDKPLILTIGSAEDNSLSVVIYESARANFERSSDKDLLNKEVCIRGRIEFYKDKPQIVVRREQDISLKNSTGVSKAN